uniref:Short-chain dehydrogenase/reductase family 16C member 6 n=1 Tax=Rhabditophanes sp. KR3021 TaxID=114890 RepID=A0AC35TVZ8_9BILA
MLLEKKRSTSHAINIDADSIETKPKKGCEPLHTQILMTIAFWFLYMAIFFTKDVPRYFKLRRKDVTGKVIVITGGALGIGQSLAYKFALTHKAKVVIVDINESEGNKTLNHITSSSGIAYFFKCDVSKGSDLLKVAQSIYEHPDLGTVDILLCNAAVLRFGDILNLTEDDYRLNNDINILGYILTVKAFLPQMIQLNKGQVVFMGSICSFYGDSSGTAYCTAKFAVRGLLESIRIELLERGKKGVATTIIHPYFVRTGLITGQIKDPFSTFFDVLTVEECVQLSIDAILKERVEAFIPGSLSLLCYYMKCFNTVNIFPYGRKFFNFKHEPI